MFHGENAITIDDKGRMSVPTAYREQISQVCENRMKFTRSPFDSGCLWLFPIQDWEKVALQVGPLNDWVPDHRTLKSALLGAASDAVVDGNGRILVPGSLRSACQLEKNAVLLGMGSRFELWNDAAYTAMLSKSVGFNPVPTSATPEMLSLKF